jgi:hypothetical protein
MDLTFEDNTQTAVDPQAILTSPPQKLPIYDNDPTRNVSPAESVNRFLVAALAVAALLVLVVATVMALIR